jgi:branched-chain amino acid transport system permease protein
MTRLAERRRWHRLGRVVLAAAVVLALASPFFGLPQLTPSLAATICLFGIVASGLNLMFGYAGMLSLGGALFMGMGSYGAAISAQHWRLALPAAILAAVAATTLVAFVLGLLLVHLSSTYFGVATLGLATAFEGLLLAFPTLTGGGSGITIVNRLDLGLVTIGSNEAWYALSLVVAALVLVLLGRMVRGKRGRVLRLVRQDELAASVLGVPVFWTKVTVFTAGGLFAALGGCLLFVWQGVVVPDNAGVTQSVQLIALTVVGGAGYLLGGFVGALLILWLQALVSGFGSNGLLVYGVIFLVTVFFLRRGVAGTLAEGWAWLGRRLDPSGSGPVDLGAAESGTRTWTARVRERPATAGPSSALALEVRGARKSFGAVTAVDGVSMAVRAGAVTGLIGANGAGKSTLVNLISGVEALDGGSIHLADEDISRLSPAERTRRGIVRTFQVPRLVEELTVLDNIVLGREASEGSVFVRSARRERHTLAEARDLLAEAGLASLGPRPASTLGTGQRKFVELVRAMFSEPSVCLLDEPAVGLSLAEIEEISSWLDGLRSAGAAVLVVDHNLDFVRQLADSVCVMETGRIAPRVVGGPR